MWPTEFLSTCVSKKSLATTWWLWYIMVATSLKKMALPPPLSLTVRVPQVNLSLPHLGWNTDDLILCSSCADEHREFMSTVMTWRHAPKTSFSYASLHPLTLTASCLLPLAFSRVEHISWRDIIQPTTMESVALSQEFQFWSQKTSSLAPPPQMHSSNYTVNTVVFDFYIFNLRAECVGITWKVSK